MVDDQPLGNLDAEGGSNVQNYPKNKLTQHTQKKMLKGYLPFDIVPFPGDMLHSSQTNMAMENKYFQLEIHLQKIHVSLPCYML